MYALKERYHALLQALAQAAQHSEAPQIPTLIAVSKTFPTADIQLVYDAGCRDFGENRVQELLDKIPALPSDIRWHFIGQLQRNKVKYLIGNVALIHTLDRLSLAQEIEKQATKRNVIQPCLVEINLGDEPQKGGISPADAPQLLCEIQSTMPHIHTAGLMCIPPQAWESDRAFALLSSMAREWHTQGLLAGTTLSMGMSDDFKAAIAHGATMVRIGSALFGAR
ncbi:YggS family pyridoxal phosphate-dependent enzyme [Chrysiogenes arsenatis]|uniref:YggS family pyridoxal phosphate-dependent enzyme n=1 Tax=Chrysiogenes arsenatis TaxID=309797 RepID=UPI00040545BA|nr:YggS family pyridoxal phosphate-dependent enzyme [Chrysiogenes arsenatis]